ncbi:hypothetical protein GXW84_40340 [Rhodococcus sp. IEGM 248]|uniref:hypothetical protein n=1 Tax=Rhodococcus opacus TaxID=37919 RepID=UPI0013C01B36|nr:hypothetical protein [Rhodococcus opacus]MDV7090073.1 hypothetical protein [Rhodococcus opacus]NDV10590.1 hypothetical protein [Rhodococcus sp. IEGM 248]
MLVTLRRCLTHDDLDLRVRVAAALVRLDGQIPTRIVELTTAHLSTDTRGGSFPRLHDRPVLLPQVLAALIAELIDRPGHRPSAALTPSTVPEWLFPGPASRLPPRSRSSRPPAVDGRVRGAARPRGAGGTVRGPAGRCRCHRHCHRTGLTRGGSTERIEQRIRQAEAAGQRLA